MNIDNATTEEKVAALRLIDRKHLSLLGIDREPEFYSNRLRSLEELVLGVRTPRTQAQLNFIDCYQNLRQPETEYEIAFLEYRRSLKRITADKVERLEDCYNYFGREPDPSYDYDHDTEQNLIAQEIDAYAAGVAASDDEGWFYEDEDPAPWDTPSD